MVSDDGHHDEPAFAEVEKVLLYLSDARERAERAAVALAAMGADGHLVEAVRASSERLAEEHRQLMQGTYFAVPKTQLAL